MKSFVLLLAFLGLAIAVPAQNEPVSSIRALNIGDFVPDIEFSNIINYQTKTAKLSDFKGKLVILDFWATWCSSCIHNFPNLDSLQKKFAGQIQVLLVNAKSTRDSEKKAIAFFEKRRKDDGSKYQLASALLDTVADQLFAHKLIPHYVWINGNGNVIAFTSSDQVTLENINSVLNKHSIEWSMKRDQDPDNPLFLGNDLPEDSLVQYSIFTKGWFEGLPCGSRLRKRGEIVHGMAITNTCLLQMYQTVASSLITGFNKNSLLLQIKDSSRLVPDTAQAIYPQWYKSHAYNCDLIVPVSHSDKIYDYMLENLNNCSEYLGKIEKRPVKCFVIEHIDNPKKLISKDGLPGNNLEEPNTIKYLHNQPISILAKYLDANLPVHVLDETHFTQAIDLLLPSNLRDIPSLQKALSNYGFRLVEAEREFDMLVITEK